MPNIFTSDAESRRIVSIFPFIPNGFMLFWLSFSLFSPRRKITNFHLRFIREQNKKCLACDNANHRTQWWWHWHSVIRPLSIDAGTRGMGETTKAVREIVSSIIHQTLNIFARFTFELTTLMSAICFSQWSLDLLLLSALRHLKLRIFRFWVGNLELFFYYPTIT